MIIAVVVVVVVLVVVVEIIIIIIVIIIIIAFKIGIKDFLQSLHYASNYLQHVSFIGPGAIVCKSRAAPNDNSNINNNINNNNNNNHHHRIHRRNSRFSTISSMLHQLSPTCELSWSGRKRKSHAAHRALIIVQHVVLRATWYKGTAQLLNLTDVKSHLL